MIILVKSLPKKILFLISAIVMTIIMIFSFALYQANVEAKMWQDKYTELQATQHDNYAKKPKITYSKNCK